MLPVYGGGAYKGVDDIAHFLVKASAVMAALSKKNQALILNQCDDLDQYRSLFDKSDKMLSSYAKRRTFAQSAMNSAKIKKTRTTNKKDKDKE